MLEVVRRLSRPPEIQLGEKRWPALFTHAALLDLEELSGLDVLNGELNLLKPRARDLRDAVYVLLQHAGARYSRQEVAKLCGLARMQEWRVVVVAAWRASTPDPHPRTRERGAKGKKAERQTWQEAWAIARYRLRLSDAEWLAMTPRLAHALLDQHLEDMRQRELMQSKIAASVVNFGGMGGPKEPVKDEAFMIHPWPKDDDDPEGGAGGVTGEELMDMFGAYRRAQEKASG